jgi:hypothetical protein
MSAFLYYLPLVNMSGLAPQRRLNRSLLAERGLGDVLGDVESVDDLACNEIATSAGPGGKHGMLISALPVASREPPRRMKYDAADQSIVWREVGAGDLWIGLDTQSPPRPEDLRRRSGSYRGQLVDLQDGNPWEIPTLQRYDGGTPLPRELGWDAAGKFGMQLDRRYQQLWDDSRFVAEFFFAPPADGQPKSIDFEQACDITLRVMSLNYRIGRQEASMLRLFTSRNWEQCLAAIIDYQKFVDAAEVTLREKKTSATSSTSAPDLPSSEPG